MTRVHSVIVVAAVAMVLSSASAAQAQAKPAPLSSVTAQVEVVLTRHQGETKTSSLPFTLIVNAGPDNRGRTSLRMGVDVPVGTSTSNLTQTTGAQGNSPKAVGTTKVETVFRNVGTDIDCWVTRTEEALFSVYLSVRDSSLFSSETGEALAGVGDASAFRTFSTSNTLMMADGQTRLFGVATDKITGETLRIEARLTVVK